jgi:hypothetical protein
MPATILHKNNFDQGEAKFDDAGRLDHQPATYMIPLSEPIRKVNFDPYESKSNEDQQSIEKQYQNESESISDESPMRIENTNNTAQILWELNETAVEMITQDLNAEALDSLLKAEYIISVLVPIENTPSEMKNLANDKRPDQVDDTHMCTIYYNIAWWCQKLSKLEKCVKYLEKWIDMLVSHCSKTSNLLIFDGEAKLTHFKDNTKPIAERYNDLLMKYRYLTKFNLQLCAVLSQLSQ